MITERTLKRWRKESLTPKVDNHDLENLNHILQLHQRILRLTQELMDIYLIKR